jgi:hypothetical protein
VIVALVWASVDSLNVLVLVRTCKLSVHMISVDCQCHSAKVIDSSYSLNTLDLETSVVYLCHMSVDYSVPFSEFVALFFRIKMLQ